MLGHAVGDALGCPVEFRDREFLKACPITDMIGGGTHGQPPGTWTDDTSLLLCTLEAMCSANTPEEVIVKTAENFVKWLNHGYWTPREDAGVFDVGNTTKISIAKLKYILAHGEDPSTAGGKGEYDNGNGSLMRILPASFYTFNWNIEERFEFVHKLSAITHAHPRSKMACTFYTQLAVELINRKIKGKADIQKAYSFAIQIWLSYYKNKEEYQKEIEHFKRITCLCLGKLSEKDIKSGGYVIHSLEAAIWCVLTTTSYKEAVLKAVNLGGDTDTIAALTGGLAAIQYCDVPDKNIPEKWINSLTKLEEILKLINNCDIMHTTHPT